MAEHTLDIKDSVENILNGVRWYEFAEQHGQQGRKSLQIAVGSPLYLVTRDKETIYLGASPECAVITYNTAFETR